MVTHKKGTMRLIEVTCKVEMEAFFVVQIRRIGFWARWRPDHMRGRKLGLLVSFST